MPLSSSFLPPFYFRVGPQGCACLNPLPGPTLGQVWVNTSATAHAFEVYGLG